MNTSTARRKFCLILLFLLGITGWSSSAHAQTDRIVFAVIGDYGLAGQPEADVANLVKSWNPDFIVTTGDNNYPNGTAETIDQNVGQYYQEFIYPYKGKYGNGATTRRFFPSLGNHDWGGNGVKPYIEYFGFRKNQTYYEFVEGPVHFFILDSDRNEPDGVDVKSQQAIWLRKALAASTSPFNIVVFHHAPYSSGRHGSTPYMRWTFKEWGADAVLTGHDHVYERLLVDGIPYFVNGIGGAEIYKFETILPESQARFNQDFGAMRVEATSTYMKFQMITRAGVLVDEYVIGQGAPSVTSINPLNASPTNANELVFQVTFSDSVTGVDLEDFVLNSNTNGAALNNINGSGNTYFVSVNSGSGDGILRLDLMDNDTIVNEAGISLGGSGLGNGNYTNGTAYIVDKTPPTVTSILRASPNPSNAESVDFAVTFSESVSGVDASDFLLTTNTGAQISSITGSGNFYTVAITTGIGDDALRLDFVDNDSVMDSAGNGTAGSFTGETYSMDRQPPIPTSITRTGQESASSVEYAVSFSESVTGVDGSDFFLSTLNGAWIVNVSGAGNHYFVTININPGSDVLRLDLNDDDSISDAAGNRLGGFGSGNGNLIGESVPIAIDTPIVTSIVRASQNPSSAASVDFIVTFSETVSGVDASDFALTGNSDTGILSVNSVNPFHVVSVSTGSMDGTIKLELMDNDSIANADGMPLGGYGIGNANFINGETYTIDRTQPRVTSIIRAGNNPTINPTMDFIVTFSEPVLGVDAADFSVQTTNLNSIITNVQNADPFYVVTVSAGAGSGIVRLDLIDNFSISDPAGNLLSDNGMGNGSFTTGESFNIAKIPVNFPAPNITVKLTNYLTNSPTPALTWSSVRGAQAYEVFIARDANFNQMVVSQTLTGTSFTPGTNLQDGTYHMRVWAYDGNLNPGKFSKTYSFTIDTTPPPAPTLASPADRSTTPKRPWLQWRSVTGAAQYQIQLDNNPDFTSPEFSATTHRSTIQSKTLISKRVYYWRVRAKDAAGNWSEWSEVFSLTIK